MTSLAEENAQLRARLEGFETSLAAFVEAAEGIIDALNEFVDAASTDPALHERARTLATTTAERMHDVVHSIGSRFPTYGPEA